MRTVTLPSACHTVDEGGFEFPDKGIGEVGTRGPIRVVIAEDHELFRAGLRLILSREEDVEPVGEATDGLQAIEVVSTLQPDVVLLDITMLGIDGIDIIQPLKQNSPTTKPLMLTTARDQVLIFKALKAGAKGYLSKDATVSDLTRAIQAVHHGELWVERKMIARFVEGEAGAEFRGEDRPGRMHPALTAREQEILHLLASGGTNKELAQTLFISEKTVKSHLNSIVRKLHVTRRLQAILYAVHHGLR